jgi:dihydrofolate reductase
MDYELITAYSLNKVIGKNNDIPWSVPEDLKRFYEITKNSVIIMGRKTYESLPKNGLKNRVNVVLTNNIPADPNPNIVYVNMSNVFDIVNKLRGDKKVFVIGGSEVYKLFFDNCKILHTTTINEEVDGDVYFPIDVEKLVGEGVFKNVYTSDLLHSKNNNTGYQYFTYEKV